MIFIYWLNFWHQDSRTVWVITIINLKMIASANLVQQRGEGVLVGWDDRAVVVLDGESPRSRVLGMAAGGHGGCPWCWRRSDEGVEEEGGADWRDWYNRFWIKKHNEIWYLYFILTAIIWIKLDFLVYNDGSIQSWSDCNLIIINFVNTIQVGL